jgi:hypothetical protein
MATIKDVTFDCRHSASLARFWAAALDGYDVAPYDEEELERLRSIGIHDPEDDPTVLVQGPAGAPRLWFQRVPEEKIAKNRVHLDVAASDPAAEVHRLEQLGASTVEPQPSDDGDLIVMQDPEGNEFCVVRA